MTRGRSLAIGAAIAAAVTGAAAWGPTGSVVHPDVVLTPTAMLRDLAQTNPAAAMLLEEYAPGQPPQEAGIGYGEFMLPGGLPTPELVESLIHGDKDAIGKAHVRPLPEGQYFESQRHAHPVGARDLDVVFDAWVKDANGAIVSTPFPAVTVHLADGDPPLVTGWNRATEADLQRSPPQAPLVLPAGAQPLRPPVGMEPLTAIKAYSQALLRQDIDTVVGMTSSTLADKLGGREKLRAWMEQPMAEWRRLHEYPIAEQINDLRPWSAPGIDLYFVQTTRWQEGWPWPVGTSRVYLLYTRDRGKRWEVLDLVCVGRAWLHGIAPEFHDDALVADLLPK